MNSVQRMHRRLEEQKKKYSGKIRGNYRIDGDQLLELRNPDDICGSLINAFDYGFYMGMKYYHAQTKRTPAPTKVTGEK